MADQRICSIDGCNKTSSKRGWCEMHYGRWYRLGDPLAGGIFRNKLDDICSIDGCHNKAKARNLCGKHWVRLKDHGDPLGGRQFNGAAVKYLNDVVLTYCENDCLIWPFNKDRKGYGSCVIGAKRQTVSRYVCQIVHGEPSHEQLVAAHSCGNGHLGCVNPLHIEWKTVQENQADRKIHGTYVCGEGQNCAKLTAEAVAEIRAMYGKRGVTQQLLADRFQVSRSAIYSVIHRKSWTHI